MLVWQTWYGGIIPKEARGRGEDLIVNGGGDTKLDRRDAECAEKGNGGRFNTQGAREKDKGERATWLRSWQAGALWLLGRGGAEGCGFDEEGSFRAID